MMLWAAKGLGQPVSQHILSRKVANAVLLLAEALLNEAVLNCKVLSTSETAVCYSKQHSGLVVLVDYRALTGDKMKILEKAHDPGRESAGLLKTDEFRFRGGACDNL
jgi:hypothetical protein